MAVRVPSALHEPVDDVVSTLTADALNASTRYTVTTWLPETFPPGPIVPASTTEAAIRPLGAAALGMAAAVACGVHSPQATTVTAAYVTEQVVRLVAGVAGAHKAVSPYGWGDHWQSALWAYLAGAAGWLVWDDLPTDVRAHVVAMVTYEADRMVDRPISYWRDRDGVDISPGNSRQEENAWDAAAPALAALMLPLDSRATAWTRAAALLGMAAHSGPADVTVRTTLNGLASTAVLGGYNVNGDGTVVNHNIVHPDYMLGGFSSLSAMPALFGAGDAPWPAACSHGVPLVYQALHRRQWGSTGAIYQPDGSLYYPQGNDWGTGRIAHAAASDVMAWRYGWGGTNARAAAVAHLTRLRAMQERGTDGRTYQTPEEDTYAGREQWVAQHLGSAMVALCAEVTESSASIPTLVAQSAQVGVLDGEPPAMTEPARGIVTFPSAVATKHVWSVLFDPGAFSTPPVVIASVTTAAEDGQICASAADVTATGFTAVMSHAAGVTFSSANRRVHWVAYPAAVS